MQTKRRFWHWPNQTLKSQREFRLNKAKASGKRAFYLAKNWVSEFDRGVGQMSKKYAMQCFKTIFFSVFLELNLFCSGISIKKSIWVKKDQMIGSNFIWLKNIKSKQSANENEGTTPAPQSKLGITANRRALANSRPKSEFK